MVLDLFTGNEMGKKKKEINNKYTATNYFIRYTHGKVQSYIHGENTIKYTLETTDSFYTWIGIIAVLIYHFVSDFH